MSEIVVIWSTGKTLSRLQVIPKTLNPVWDQTFEFLVEDAAHDMLQLEVWDHDTFGKVSKQQRVCGAHLS